MLRKHIPEPFIALLAFLLGIWMWNHYFHPLEGYPAGTETLALRKIDRDLRLSEAMAEDPPWMRRLAGLESPGTEREGAAASLEKLRVAKSISSPGLLALAVIRAESEGTSILPMMDRLEGSILDDPATIPENAGSWWRAKLLDHGFGPAAPPDWKEKYARSLQTLKIRSLACSAVLVVLVIAGLCFIPACMGRLAAGLGRKPRGYHSAWSPALGLAIYMIGTLAWIGYITILDVGIEIISNLPTMVALLMDTAARLLPALIAIGFLFKQPRHVVRVMSLKGPPDFPAVLSSYAVLVVAQAVLLLAMGHRDDEPGGGLSDLDAGWQGLVFAVVSACVVAPVVEEILYRGVLFRSLANRMGLWAGALVSSIIFSAVHFYGLEGFLSVALFGFMAAVLYSATGSLLPAILLHVLHNAMIKVPAWIFYQARIEW